MSVSASNSEGVAEALRQATERAEAVRARMTTLPGDAGDVAEVASSGLLLERFLGDVEEAIRQVFTAGLSYPDPELPDELESLAERAERHGLPSAVGHLQRLRVWVQAISAEQEIQQRHAVAQQAWDETQRLVSWLRLFRTELWFLTVEGRLVSRAAAGGGERRQQESFATRSLTVWPVGLELERGGKLLIFCQDRETGAPVVLRDHLSEFDADRPLGQRVISRLFQDSVDLGQVMRALIRLEDHPVVQRRSSLLFRPAFRAIPKVLPITDDFEPPVLPALVAEEVGEPPRVKQVPARLRAAVSSSGGQIRWEAPIGIETSPLLRLNVTKLLAKLRRSRQELDLVARPKGDLLRVLSATDEDGERVFLADDPTLFRVAANDLADSAQRTAGALVKGQGGAAVTGALLRGTAYLYGGVDPQTVDELRDELRDLELTGVETSYRLALARFLLGEPTAPDPVEPLARDALQLALLAQGAAVPVDALSRALGRKAGPADIRHLTEDDQLVYRALWLVHEAGLQESLQDLLQELVARRYSGQLKHAPSPSLICARSLATHMVEVLEGIEGEGEEEEGDDGEGGEAVTFLQAHLADLQSRGRRRKRAPMPELLELFQLADTWAVVTGADRHASSVAQLGLPWLEVAQACAGSLLEWRTASAPSVGRAAGAAEALLLIAAGGLRGYFVS